MRSSIPIAALLVILVGVLNSLGFIPHRKHTNADFGIAAYRSQHDQDRDGIDDQTDILESVRTYLATNPKYGSKYYASGYSNDEYGVCTDVVAQGLRGAGYDLMQLVNQDILDHPEFYDVETPDAKIDFRRVKNLVVWFQRHTQALTTDVHDYQAWQGGDIVIFKDHIGVISDYRNRRGMPYLIHHYSPWQIDYEEDALLNYQSEIIGHYRVS